MLYRSYVGNHSCYEFVCAIVIPCPEDSTSPCSLTFISFLFLFSALFHNPSDIHFSIKILLCVVQKLINSLNKFFLANPSFAHFVCICVCVYICVHMCVHMYPTEFNQACLNIPLLICAREMYHCNPGEHDHTLTSSYSLPIAPQRDVDPQESFRIHDGMFMMHLVSCSQQAGSYSFCKFISATFI